MAGLSKQHFINIAEIINTHYKRNDFKVCCVLDILINDFSDYFKTQNPLFNENQFKKACLK